MVLRLDMQQHQMRYVHVFVHTFDDREVGMLVISEI